MKKYISFITIVCFLFSYLGAPALDAALDVARDAQQSDQFRSAVNAPCLTRECTIPASLGRVTAMQEFNSDTLVINIQDLHCHAETQRNIAKIISCLDRQYSLGNVYVEGGYGNIDTSWLTAISDTGARKQILESLVDQGRLSGAEYYSMSTGRFGLLKGLEHEKLHKENIVRLGLILEKQRHFRTVLRAMSRDMDLMNRTQCGPRNRRLDRILAARKSGSLGAEQYYRRISKYVEQINAHPEDFNNLYALRLESFPAIMSYVELMKARTHIPYKQVSRQLQAFTRKMKSRMTFGAYNQLLATTDNLSNYEALYLQSPGLEKEYHLDMRRRFPALYGFLKIVDLNRMINPVALVSEDKRLVEELRFAFSKDTVELDVSFLNDFFDTFSDYFTASLSAEDYAYFISRLETFKTLWGKYVTTNRINDVAADFQLLDTYYAVNAHRNEIFLNTIFSQLPAPHARERNVIVIVTGGFHSEGVSRLLEEKKISYLTITPQLSTDADLSSRIFQNQVRQQAKLFSSQALSVTLPACNARVVGVNDREITIQINGVNDQVVYAYDGTRWNLQAPHAGGFAAWDDARVEQIQHITAAINDAAAMAGAVLPDRMGYTIECVSALIKACGAWGAYHGLWGNSGLIWCIATNKDVYKLLEGKIDHIARLPSLLQEAELYSAKKKLNIGRIVGKQPVLAAILETEGKYVYALWQFIHQTDGVEAAPVKSSACEKILMMAHAGLKDDSAPGIVDETMDKMYRAIRKVPAIDAYSQNLFTSIVTGLRNDSGRRVRDYLLVLDAFNKNPPLKKLLTYQSNKEMLLAALANCLDKPLHTFSNGIYYDGVEKLCSLVSEYGDETMIDPLLGLAETAWGAGEYGVANDIVTSALDIHAEATIQGLWSLLLKYRTPSSNTDGPAQGRMRGVVSALANIAEIHSINSVPDAVDLLHEIMRDERFSGTRTVRVSAARALRALGDRSQATRSILTTALEAGDGVANYIASSVLKKEGDVSVLPVILARSNLFSGLDPAERKDFVTILRNNSIETICSVISNLAERDMAHKMFECCLAIYPKIADPRVKDMIVSLLCRTDMWQYINAMRMHQKWDSSEMCRDLVSAVVDHRRDEIEQYQALRVLRMINDAVGLVPESSRLLDIMHDTRRQISVRARAAALLALTRESETQFNTFYAMHNSSDEAEQACGYAGLASLAMKSKDVGVALGENSNFTAHLMLWAKREHAADIEQDLVFLGGICAGTKDMELYVVGQLKNNTAFEVRAQAAKSLALMHSLGGLESLFQVANDDVSAAVSTAAINAIVSIIYAELYKPTNGELIDILKNSMQGKLRVMEKVGDATIATIDIRAIWNLMKYLTVCGLENDTVYLSLSHIMKKLSHKKGLSPLADMIIPYLKSDDKIVVSHAEDILSHACGDPKVLSDIVALIREPNMDVPVMHTLCLAFTQYKEKVNIRPEMFDVDDMRTHEAQTFAALLRASIVKPGTTVKDSSVMYRWCLRVLSDSELKYKKLAYQLIEPILISTDNADVVGDEIEAVVQPLVAVINSTEPQVTDVEKRYAAKILFLLSSHVPDSQNSILQNIAMFREISEGNNDETEGEIVNYVLQHAAPLLKRIGFQSLPRALQEMVSALSARKRKISLVDEGDDLLMFLNAEFRNTVDRIFSGRHAMQESLVNNSVGYYGLAIAAARLLRQNNRALNDEAMRLSALTICEQIILHWDDAVLDNDTVFLGIYGDERHQEGASFSSKAIRDIMTDMEIEPAKKLFVRKTDPHDVYTILRTVLLDTSADKKMVWFSSHGRDESLALSDGSSTRLFVAQCAEIFRDAARKGVDLSKVTVVIDSCRSHNFAVTLLNRLSESGICNLPTIITVAEKHRSGYSTLDHKSQFEVGLARQLTTSGRRGKIFLHDLIQSGLITDRQDSSVFVPVDAENIALKLSGLPLRSMSSQQDSVADDTDTDQNTTETLASKGAGEMSVPIEFGKLPSTLKIHSDILQVNMRPQQVAQLAIAGFLLFVPVVILGITQIMGAHLLPALIAVGGLYAALSPFVNLEKKRIEIRLIKSFIIEFIHTVLSITGIHGGGHPMAAIRLSGRLSLVSGEASTSADGRETEFVSVDPSASEIRVVPAHFEVLSLLNTNPVTRFLMRVSLYTNGTVGHETYHILNPTKGEVRPFIYTQALPAIVGYMLFVSAGLLLGLPGIPIIVTGLIFGTRVGIGLAGLKLNMDLNREVRNISFAWIINHDTHYQDRVTLSNETAFVPVVVTDVKPDGWDENRTDIVSLGKTNDGQAVWGASEHNHLIIYCTENPLSTAKYVQGQLTPTAAMKGNASLARGLMTLVHRTAGRHSFADASDMTFDPGIYVQSDERSHEMSYAYDSDGEMVVTVAKDGVKTIDADALRSLRAIQSGDNVAMARSFIFRLDDADMVEDIQTILSLRGQQVLVTGIEKAHKVQAVIQTLQKDHHMNLGIRVFAMVNESDAVERTRELAGCVMVTASGKKTFHDNTFPDSDGILASEDRAASAPIWIVNVSAITSELNNGRFFDKVGVTKMFGANVLAFFRSQVYSERYVRDAVYGFTVDEFITAQTRMHFLNAMKSIVDDKKYAALTETFDKAVAERKHVEEWIAEKSSRSPIPLHHKQMLGTALSLKNEQKGPVQTIDANHGQLTEEGINIAFQAMRTDPKPSTIEALIALIELYDMQFADFNIQRLIIDDNEARNITAILSAA